MREDGMMEEAPRCLRWIGPSDYARVRTDWPGFPQDCYPLIPLPQCSCSHRIYHTHTLAACLPRITVSQPMSRQPSLRPHILHTGRTVARNSGAVDVATLILASRVLRTVRG